MHFENICSHFSPTPPRSTASSLSPQILYSLYFLNSTLNPHMLIFSWCRSAHWGATNLPGITLLEATDTLSPGSHQPFIIPWGEMRTCESLLFMLESILWRSVQVTTIVTPRVWCSDYAQPLRYSQPFLWCCQGLGSSSEAFKVEVLLVVENSPGSYSMQLDWLWIFACTTVDYTKKILWWCLKAALIYRYSDMNLKGSLILCLLSRVTVVGSFPKPYGLPSHEFLERFAIPDTCFLLWYKLKLN